MKELVMYSAPWCASCKALKGKITVPHSIIDIQADPVSGLKANISALPTLIVYDDEGREVYRHTGMAGHSELQEVYKNLK